MNWLFNIVDRVTERSVRQVAHRHGRRSFITRLGTGLVGGALLPMLPFDRSGQFGAAHAAGAGAAPKNAKKSDPTQCDYWRYCAIDGYLCTCCGGSLTTCPPGTEVSKVSWVGTCLNPDDGRHYLVSYNDCCGKGSCGECLCNNNERERPGYRLGVHNDINWCMANTNSMFHCTTAIIVGTA
ncbi:methylamine dehydrogenase light chain [Limnohabitans sp.]|jgi:methylamine dehydrogenase light chain|uniref:methylamine dehydrogenase light chain n=1 Tax=Limnohabitans sp. TaxID=1907725 RepID=UPI0037BFDE95